MVVIIYVVPVVGGVVVGVVVAVVVRVPGPHTIPSHGKSVVCVELGVLSGPPCVVL